MQKIINDPHNVVDEMLHGFYKCHKDVILANPGCRVITRKGLETQSRVGIVSGGGSGHMPAFVGYVREGMLDAAAVGNVFVAPDAEVFLEAFKSADMGHGVICLHGNYELDNRNVKTAIELAKQDGIEVRRVVLCDEVQLANSDGNGRGLAGEVFLWKLGGAASALGYSLDEVERVCRNAAENLYSIGVGLSACIIPEVGVANFDVAEGTMEVGIGHHGEPGITTCKLRTSNEIAALLMDIIFEKFKYSAGDSIAVMLSGMGSTTQMELYILYDRIHDLIEERGLSVEKSYVGNYFTSLDMAGVTVTVLRLDDELKKLLTCEPGMGVLP